VLVESPVIKTKWSHMPITFLAKGINLASFPHTDVMVITVHINRWDVTRILVDNGSQAEVLFLSAFDKMGYDTKQLKELMKPLDGFGGKRINPVGVITLPVSFSNPENPRIKCITIDVVDMHYSYNAIFRRGLLNIFEIALHSSYLCLKVPTTLHIISVFNSQKDARNIEQGFTPGHKNVHFIRDESEQYQQSTCPIDTKASHESKKAIKVDGDIKKVALDPRVRDKVVCLGTEMTPGEHAKLLAFLDRNNDIFAWSTSNLTRVSRDIIEHRL
jgi:hypothetical protein